MRSEAGVERFIYMSSCSVYGSAGATDSTETSEVQPLTAYAKCKVLVERDVAPLAADDFSPTFLRNATAFGASPRMRFDLVVNDLAGHAWTEKVIRMDSDGRPWRPFVHILDISQAIDLVLARAARRRSTARSSTSAATCRTTRSARSRRSSRTSFPGCRTEFGDSTGDHRNYRANFDKIRERLPFETRYDVARGAQQLLDVFRAVT